MPEVVSGKAFSLVTAINPYAKDINRLISSLVPSGKVVFQDDFENTALKWRNTLGTTARDTTNYFPFMGNACLQIDTAAVIESRNETYKRLHALRNMRMGLEMWFLLPSFANINYIQFSLDRDGPVRNAEIQYDPVTTNLSYYNSAGGLTNFGTLPNWHIDAYQHMKLIADLVTGYYVSFEIGDELFDLSSYRVWSATGGNREVFASITIETAIAGVKSIYVDDVIVTNEES